MSLEKKSFKICISSLEGTLEGKIDSRFGRCEYFLVVNIEDGKVLNTQAVKNEGFSKDSGAGFSAAEQVSKLGVDVLITGNVGPKAEAVLSQLEIEVLKRTGNTKDVVADYLNDGSLSVEAEEITGEVAGDDKSAGKDRLFIPLMNDQGKNSEISLHFGHAPYLGVYDVENGKLTIKENKLDHADLTKSPVDQIVEQVNPTLVYAQDMGSRAINLFTEKNILLKTGPYKIVGEVMANLENLSDLTSGCGH